MAVSASKKPSFGEKSPGNWEKSAEFSKFWREGAKAPSETDWIALIGEEPTLILLDELPPYFDYAVTRVIGKGNLAQVTTYALFRFPPPAPWRCPDANRHADSADRALCPGIQTTRMTWRPLRGPLRAPDPRG